MAYSDFGLDDTKKSKDDDQLGVNSYCPWCQKDVANGFSMCFSHFCICIDCLERALNKKRGWKPDDGNGCFKCYKGKAKEKPVYEKLFYDKAGSLSICEECVKWGHDVLINREKYLQEEKNKITLMVLDILKQCTVEGNIVKLPAGQLDRKVYEAIKKQLEGIGGKWKGGKIQGFVFDHDPTELLAAQANGEDINLKQDYQFFPTPQEIAEMMVLHLAFKFTPDDKILEPSAGDGALVKALIGKHPVIEAVDCFEIMELNRKKLEKLPAVRLIGEDFLLCDLKNTYDYIIANPPFTKGQDVLHIAKMYECLKPGGKIVTISSQSWTFNSIKFYQAFKVWIEDELKAKVVKIPAGEFAESGTNIAVAMIVIEKPFRSAPEIPAIIIEKMKFITEGDITDSKTIEKQAEPEHPFPFLRKYEGYVLYDGGKYTNGMHQVLIFPDCITVEKDTEPVHIAYYDMDTPGDVNKGIELGKAWVNQLRRCRECGCTQYNCKQCIDKTGNPCNWVEEDLCSACKMEPSPQEIIQQMENTNAEIVKGTAELKRMLTDEKFDHPNFFENLHTLLDGVEIDMNVKRIAGGRLSIRFVPKTISNLRPVELKGTPQDLSEGFFDAIKAPVQAAVGLKVDTEQFHKSIVEVKKDQEQTTSRKQESKKSADKKVDKAKGKKAKPAAKKALTAVTEEEQTLF